MFVKWEFELAIIYGNFSNTITLMADVNHIGVCDYSVL